MPVSLFRKSISVEITSIQLNVTKQRGFFSFSASHFLAANTRIDRIDVGEDWLMKFSPRRLAASRSSITKKYCFLGYSSTGRQRCTPDRARISASAAIGEMERAADSLLEFQIPRGTDFLQLFTVSRGRFQVNSRYMETYLRPLRRLKLAPSLCRFQ